MGVTPFFFENWRSFTLFTSLPSVERASSYSYGTMFVGITATHWELQSGRHPMYGKPATLHVVGVQNSGVLVSRGTSRRPDILLSHSSEFFNTHAEAYSRGGMTTLGVAGGRRRAQVAGGRRRARRNQTGTELQRLRMEER